MRIIILPGGTLQTKVLPTVYGKRGVRTGKATGGTRTLEQPQT